MSDTLLAESTREAEESRIAANWLQRISNLLPQEQQPLFQRALNQAGVSHYDLERLEHLHQHQLDSVVRSLLPEIPDLTLRLFARAEILDLGLVGYAAINSGSVGKALKVMYQYHGLASDRYEDNLEMDGDTALIFPTPLPGYSDDFQNIVEDSFSGNWRALQVLLGPRADPQRIKLKFEHPAPAYVATYHEVFGPNCQFEQPLTELRFPAAWLELPVNHGSGALSQVYTAICERVLGPGESGRDTPQMVRRLLLSRPGRRMLRLEEAAEQLRLSGGQLRKRLYRAGTSYKTLVLEIRMELARHYLLESRLSIQEIAYLLDYSTPAPFSRAFKLYFGMAPEYFREENTTEH